MKATHQHIKTGVCELNLKHVLVIFLATTTIFEGRIESNYEKSKSQAWAGDHYL